MREPARAAKFLTVTFVVVGGGCSLLVDTSGLTRGAPDITERGSDAGEAGRSDADASDSRVDAPLDGAPNEAGSEGGGPLTYREIVLADGPSGYWRMGARTGVTIPDETGTANALTLTGGFVLGGPGAIAGDSDTAVHFDGTTGLATANDARPFDFPNDHPFTIEAWGRNVPLAGGSQYQHLLGDMIDQGGALMRNGYYMYVATFGTSRIAAFELDTPGVQNVPSGPAADIGTWAHYVGTFDGSALRVYVNAALVKTVARSGGAITSRASHLVVGGVEAPNEGFFAGDIDEVAIYPKALDLSQITNHHDKATGK